MAVRVASLEAEIERLRAQRATDQDHIAEMLLSLAEAEKRKADALTRATDAEHRLATTRTAMAEVLKLLEDLERREEMATGVRARTIDEARRALTSERPAPPARNSPRPPAQEAPPASVRVPVAGAAPVGFADPGPAVAAGTPVARPAPSSGPEPVADLFGELPGQT
jgi:septal ring factor EnvC (AmiA/AmiB activator)